MVNSHIRFSTNIHTVEKTLQGSKIDRHPLSMPYKKYTFEIIASKHIHKKKKLFLGLWIFVFEFINHLWEIFDVKLVHFIWVS
jgi:hypothetical protein